MPDSSDSDSDESLVDAVGAILPIQQQDVHRIVSGQVISDMSSAVKELVDNALDAGSTSINSKWTSEYEQYYLKLFDNEARMLTPTKPRHSLMINLDHDKLYSKSPIVQPRPWSNRGQWRWERRP